MAFTLLAVSLLALCSGMTAEAKSFLHAKEEDMEHALQSQITEVVLTQEFEVVKKKLSPMFAALPKGEDGGLEPAAVRFALHRYFAHEYGWQISGLTHKAQSNSSFTKALMTPWTPARIQVLMEGLLMGRGFTLSNLAAFAMTIADLVRGEVVDRLYEVFEALGLSAIDTLTEDESDESSRAYLLSYLSDRKYSFSTRQDWESAERDWAENWPNWYPTLTFGSDLSNAYDHFHSDTHNPFIKRETNFVDMVGFMEEFGQQFGGFQKAECIQIKERLMQEELGGSGRLLLSQFYRSASSQFHFTETLDYLRHTQVLDESDPKRTMIIIPNYISSKSNCMKASAFYSICCASECEDLMAQVERKIQQPAATPGRIASVVSLVNSDTVHAPRNLSSALLARLDDIAMVHNGDVPLHGRLFAQWMHHAFPRECPFPQIGESEAMLPEDWMDATTTDSVEISDRELNDWKSGRQGNLMDVTEEHLPTLPWIHTEDLVVGNNVIAHKQDVQMYPSWISTMRFGAVAAGMAAFALKMLKMLPRSLGSSSDNKLEKHLV